MAKGDFAKFINSIKEEANKHAPEILTGFGIAGMITTTVLAVVATPKAIKAIEKEISKQNDAIRREAEESGATTCQQISKLKPLEVIKTAGPYYIPAAVTCAASTACLIGATSVSARRNAVLATAYKLSESALLEYKEKVVETVGEKKEEAIRDKVHKKHIDEAPVSKAEVIITGGGDSLCYDHHSGRYFKSDIEKIRRAVNILNRNMLNENYVSLNDFYDEIGLKATSLGYRLGWNVDMGLIDIDFSAQLTDKGEPCLAIDYRVPPKYDFDRFL